VDDEYKESLVKQFDWYLEKINEMHRNGHWYNLPSDSFIIKLGNGSIKTKKDDVEWLEYAVDKLQKSLSIIEERIERLKKQGKQNDPLRDFKYL
jgi:hypothetical protein